MEEGNKKAVLKSFEVHKIYDIYLQNTKMHLKKSIQKKCLKGYYYMYEVTGADDS